jgi:asparagine synthase (glutamine-hydrolysing)
MYWMTALLAEGQKQGLGAMLTGQGGNATISWTGDPEPYLLEYLVKLQWATLGRKFRAWQEVTERSLWAAVRSQIVRPLLIPVRQGMRRFRGPADAWREHSPINVAFARELDLTHLMAQQGHDPTFSRKRDYSKLRMDLLILPGRSTIGNLWCELGAAYGLEVRDPTNDPRVMSFCCSIPNNQHVRDYRDRLLIRRAMAGCLPERVLWNRRRGVQAADVAQRLIHHRSELDAALASLERSELARHYLDLPKMRTVFESVQHRIERKSIGQCSLVLLRGLMVGLFLLQFDTSHAPMTRVAS